MPGEAAGYVLGLKNHSKPFERVRVNKTSWGIGISLFIAYVMKANTSSIGVISDQQPRKHFHLPLTSSIHPAGRDDLNLRNEKLTGLLRKYFFKLIDVANHQGTWPYLAIQALFKDDVIPRMS
ncbi:hypothetical protein AL066_04365 [Pseudomonas nunensis]|nr:hypothetical protein AL066_04365 [Pseudomonas nunensis]